MTNRSMRLSGIVAVGLCSPLLVLGACSKKSNDSSKDSTTTTTAPANTTTTTAPGSPVNLGANVEASEFSFSPSAVTVKVGQAVSWRDIGSSKHTVTPDVPAGEAEPWVSQKISPDDPAPFVVTFSQPGTYNYFCSIHPDRMTGSITVTES